ncbi:MAG TPA: hypothetical protein VKA01_00275, partial [Vicinamibacteria bacterium]|nr:hypothetical protein [Vicinamibacteria bacterium]
HRKLRAAAAAVPEASLSGTAAGRRTTNLTLIRGVAAHDLYHAGQIQILKRLARALPRKKGGPSGPPSHSFDRSRAMDRRRQGS